MALTFRPNSDGRNDKENRQSRADYNDVATKIKSFANEVSMVGVR